MNMRGYTSRTLVGNWHEDRCDPSSTEEQKICTHRREWENKAPLKNRVMFKPAASDWLNYQKKPDEFLISEV